MPFKKIRIVALNFFFMCLSIPVATAQIPSANTPYLALGDSIAFGYNPQVKNWDLKKYIGYPVILSNALHLDLTNASCPGETSETFVGPSTAYLPGFNCQKFSDNNQLFVSYHGSSQLNYAIDYLKSHPNTSLVTINIGGNDLGLVQVSCAGDAACEMAELPGALAAVGQNLDLIFADLRGIGYNGPIVALNYYAFNYLDPTQVAAFTALNTAITTTAALHNVAVADAFRSFFVASLLRKGDACAAGLLLRDPTTNTCDTHPSPAGQALLAATVLQAIPRH